MSFEKLMSLEEQNGGAKASAIDKMFSSHPETKERIKRMSERATKDGFARPESTATENK